MFNTAPANSSVLAWAKHYRELGFHPIPVEPGGKKPLVSWRKYQTEPPTDEELAKWFDKPANIGLVLGRGVIAVDLDQADAEKRLADRGIEFPELAPRSKTAKGHHVLLEAPTDLGDKVGLIPGVDIRGVGYVVAPPSRHATGHVYAWEVNPCAVEEIPLAPQQLVDLIRNGAPKPAATSGGDAPKWLTEALKGVGEGERDATCAKLVGYYLSKRIPIDVTRQSLYNWADKCKPAFPHDEVDKCITSIESKDIANRTKGAENGQLVSEVISEDLLAAEFTREHGADWRYVAAWGQWMQFNGDRWVKEDTLRVFDLARGVCRRAASSRTKDHQAAVLSSAHTVAAVERLARADRAHAATVEQWDQDPWLLNTPGGIIDLRTGSQRAHDRSAHMTKMSSASLGQDCPRWRTFLREVTDGDEQLERYLARMAGYTLTGRTTEHALFFFHGTGANGKSVFLNTLGAMMGDYATTASIDTFLASQNERHPTDVAMLRGARLVSSIELTQGRRWDEAKLKSLTGGDKVAARFMRQDYFEFVPEFKLLIAGNHKPGLRDVDEAMRRRLHLIPFTVTIPREKRQHDLAERLFDERDGILAWAVEGCLEWQRDGLMPPQRVLDATDEYFQAEDALGRWISEACYQDEGVSATTAMLFANYKAWAEAAGEHVGSEKRFSQELASRGFEKWRQPGTGKMGFKKITLKSSEEWV